MSFVKLAVFMPDFKLIVQINISSQNSNAVFSLELIEFGCKGERENTVQRQGQREKLILIFFFYYVTAELRAGQEKYNPSFCEVPPPPTSC